MRQLMCFVCSVQWILNNGLASLSFIILCTSTMQTPFHCYMHLDCWQYPLYEQGSNSSVFVSFEIAQPLLHIVPSDLASQSSSSGSEEDLVCAVRCSSIARSVPSSSFPAKYIVYLVSSSRSVNWRRWEVESCSEDACAWEMMVEEDGADCMGVDEINP